jgi:excisionase family DNA binding protein
MSMDRLVRERVLAEQLDVARGTLRRWRAEGGGPRYVKIGRSIRYDPDDVQAYLKAARTLPGQRQHPGARCVHDVEPVVTPPRARRTESRRVRSPKLRKAAP